MPEHLTLQQRIHRAMSHPDCWTGQYDQSFNQNKAALFIEEEVHAWVAEEKVLENDE